jgi:hypothetical protein
MRMLVIAIAAAAIIAPAPAQAITSIEAYETLIGRMSSHCLLGSLTGATRREIAKIMRDAQAWRCDIYLRQFDRLMQRCQSNKPENSEVCARARQGHIVRRLPPPDPRRREWKQ